MFATTAAHADRRADERHLTLFRVGSMIDGDKRELCLVKNISAGGALIRAYSAVEAGRQIVIELKEGQRICGEVSWVQGNDAGITFDAPVDIAELLKSSAECPKPRMPRVDVDCAGLVREGAALHRIRVRNISQGGLSVDSPSPLSVGGDVTVSLPGLSSQSASVRWKDGTHYGISFNVVLPLAGLVAWLNGQKTA